MVVILSESCRAGIHQRNVVSDRATDFVVPVKCLIQSFQRAYSSVLGGGTATLVTKVHVQFFDDVACKMGFMYIHSFIV